MVKIWFAESENRPPNTKLSLSERLKRVPVELNTFLEDREAEIELNVDKWMLIVGSNLQGEEELVKAAEKCLMGLDFEITCVIKTTFK